MQLCTKGITSDPGSTEKMSLNPNPKKCFNLLIQFEAFRHSRKKYILTEAHCGPTSPLGPRKSPPPLPHAPDSAVVIGKAVLYSVLNH